MNAKTVPIMLAAALVCSLSACGNTNTNLVTSDSPTANVVSTPSPTPSNTALSVGSATTLGDWSITVSSIEFSPQIDSGDGFTVFNPDAGNQFLIVHSTVQNNGKQAASFLPSIGSNADVGAIVCYNKDYKYQPTNLLGYDNNLCDFNANPLTSKEGVIAFEVPEAVVNGSESLAIEFTQGTKSAVFVLR